MNKETIEQFKSLLEKMSITITNSQIQQFNHFADELKKWNKKINLTAIDSDQGIITKHFIDSLTALKVINGKGNLLDIGSGAGFPSIVIKIIYPELEIISVDSVTKKISFQKHITRLLSIKGYEPKHVRAETLQLKYANYFDWIISRAFSNIETFATIALPLIKRDGKIVAMKGKNPNEEIFACKELLEKMNAVVETVIEFKLPETEDARSLVVIAKK